jgi:hypothetical protein
MTKNWHDINISGLQSSREFRIITGKYVINGKTNYNSNPFKATILSFHMNRGNEVGIKDIFEPTPGNGSSHEIINYNAVGVVNFVTSKT